MEDKLPRVSQTIIEGQLERKRVEERVVNAQLS